MPQPGGKSEPGATLGGGQAASEANPLRRLLRCSHIFAATVRELLHAATVREVSPAPLSLAQMHLLKLMALDGQRPVGQVAEFLGISPPAATKNVDKLERLGLLVRQPSTADRRAMLLSISPKGRRLVRRFDQRETARLSAACAELESREMAQLTRLLEQLALSLLNQDPVRRGFCLRCGVHIEGDCPVGQIRGGCPYERAPTARGDGQPVGRGSRVAVGQLERRGRRDVGRYTGKVT